MQNFYPLIFKSIFHYRIWGGNQLREQLNKNYSNKKIGESWEISSFPEYQSIVENGIYKNLTINNLIDLFGKYFLGTKVYKKFNKEFPLLIKFLATSDELSIQVHPEDNYAKKHYNSFGKNEMWYILDAKKDSNLIIGFNKNTNKKECLRNIKTNKLTSLLKFIVPKKNEVYMIPAKKIHGIGKNLLIVEIQQKSNITYRIYDYNRIDENGKKRSLNLERAMQIIDFHKEKKSKIIYKEKNNEVVDLVCSPFFITQKLVFNLTINLKFSNYSFTILILTEGELTINSNESQTNLNKGQTVLCPAELNEFQIKPRTKKAEILLVRMFN